ncbi:multifunctional 2',3'-cyclic-nucleotide 2'-phosphodiesterase/5'-nucleotidase/3'-nucleotidase [Actinoplanes ianthinogenes]|uniref:Multifunctional 2',3'-cyclic-nucleotide 2'-phosphodiesterase/5'-nucleotidase/3'-nucleotidase n=1 Tax=Actinoplanes ianthinogenes TaxID=122358 RepID=A0ABN6CJX3_9ACTN|nr:5'-nucleotidase C-terminal domain-containing protein [Actinoplanes ianthinogenes]BCJ45093.1 multifunctional 2',3'-cyclic-nucleotide 2'-phosphodiesterase/5'-nucleotidase/3'-nucleotidase [Actinoplanes ianthinogenes]GGR40529.1 multifunctional 2',3'-cyclic-nucleotide 2'-phosphodiesterase/5'-nucleotidase/3'-nucleotidase [Actinoplanes ianthinogenes]
MTLPNGVSRRSVLAASAAAAAAPLAFPGAAEAHDKGGPKPPKSPETFHLTVLGTSDMHGNVYNWDYYKDAEYDDSAHNDVGVAKLAALVNKLRAEATGATLVLDAGDTIQGTPLATYYAKQEPITETGEKHPMAKSMNVLHYDAVTLGNHEFNYGLPLLNLWIRQLGFPALAANAVSAKTGKPAFTPYVIKKVSLGKHAPTLRVGILGLTNPGVAIWDKGNVEGKLNFLGMVETAAKWVPIMRARGADLVIVSAHGGDSGTSSYGPELPNENPVQLIAQQVPGIDAILFGHAHQEIPQRFVTNTATGAQVLTSEPSKFGQRLTKMDFELVREHGCWKVATKASTTLNTNTVEADPKVLAVVKSQHDKTVAYVNQIVAASTEELSAATSRYEDTAILDYINKVQTDEVVRALAGTSYASLPVLSIAAPFSRTAVFPKGNVKIKDVAGLYIYDNTLEAVVLTGAEVRAYLEYSAKYFKTLAVGAPVDVATINDSTVPDYNYDTLSGVEYDIDISKPVGSRITKLQVGGVDVAADAQFVVAVNNYRRSGGGNFPGIVKTQVYNEQKEIRQLLIDWAQAKGQINPADFFVKNWQLVREGVPVTF